MSSTQKNWATRLLQVVVALLLFVPSVLADGLDDVLNRLTIGSQQQVQEKVYVHTDNQCYFVGDTLWWKAYVVRADDLRPTNMSRLLYVELLSPDGLLVERQTVVVSAAGHTCGQFALRDSLYSGYYELRAYTRWMLNFNVRSHRYSTHDTWLFYNRAMAADYFRLWDGLYSRVFPVYSKPETEGDYDVRRMYQRPKTRLPRQKKDMLHVTFYPEGGHLLQGVSCRVAFEVTDQHGEAVTIRGQLDDGTDLTTEYIGRGTFTLTPGSRLPKARFTWRGKEWTFDLPRAEADGVALSVVDGQVLIKACGAAATKELGLAVMSGGMVRWSVPVSSGIQDNPASPYALTPPWSALPSGVTEIAVFDTDGKLWADRLLFVNNHEHDGALIRADWDGRRTLQPYEHVEMPLTVDGVQEATCFSVAIRDASTDEPSYDNGDILTSLLLSSEVKGFVVRPQYYFEQDDETHRRHLDLLMMVQGWRRYSWQQLVQGERTMRYQPERTMTIEGAVYKMLNVNEVEPDEVGDWQNGVGMVARKNPIDDQTTDPFSDEPEEESDLISTEDTHDVSVWDEGDVSIEYGSLGNANDHVGVNHGNLRQEVLVEAEVVIGTQSMGAVQRTNGGRFLFEIPPFFGDAFLNMKAYNERDSLIRNMSSRKDTQAFDEDAWPDFYVKRDLFFPMFTRDYDFYEKHQPDYDAEMLIDTLSDLSMENDVHQLGNVNVRGHRRGRRAIDWHKPAFVMDAYDLYNEVTDRGLSFGRLDMRQFPVQVCRYLYGNMNRYNSFHVDGRLAGATYYRNYSPVSSKASEAERAGVFRANRTSQWVYSNLKLKRLQDIRVFSDYEPRTEDSLLVEERYGPDATVELVPIPDEGRQVSFRDRHIVLHGVNLPEAFYQPDYSERTPSDGSDYRRTLYWNPNAITDEEGHFKATFWNNGKETRIRMSAAGITPDGRVLHTFFAPQ